MARNIQSINPFTKTTIYINFENGTFGIRKFENDKWSSVNLSDAELAAAKKLAVKDGKWTKWNAPRQTTTRSTTKHDPLDGELETPADRLEVARKNATRGEGELAG